MLELTFTENKMATSTTPSIDYSYGFTDEKNHRNLEALTAEFQVKGCFYAEETHNFASLADGAGETGSIVVNGAELGDMVQVSVGVDLQDMTLTGYVQAADTVEYRLQNESGGVVDLASTTVRVLVTDVT